MNNVSLKTKKTMKNNYIYLSAALLIFAVASCQKEVEAEIEEPIQTTKPERVGSIPFSLEANIIETKTALNTDTYAVSWEDSDIIYAVTTDSEWGAGTSSSDSEGDNVVEFSYADGRFSTSELISDGSHTFHFLYSGNDQKKYHRGSVTTHQLYASQNFDANNPTSNLKLYDALVGQTAITTPAPLATVSFDHLYALMKVTLKNKTGEAITASKFEMTAEDADIVGVYTVTFGATPSVAIKSLGGDKVTVNISNGAIANNGELPIYFVIAPLDAYDGNITFKVTDSNDKTYSKTNAVSGLTFAAGSYNTANFSLKVTPPKTYSRINDIDDFTTGEYVIVGEKTETSFGLFTYSSPDGSNRIAYSQAYTNLTLPDDITTSETTQIFTITVSGSGSKSATITNTKEGKSLAASSGLSWVTSSPTSFTVTASDNQFSFATATTYLGVNKSANYWRDYASGTLTQTNGLILYKYEEPTDLVSIAIDPSSTHPTSFYKDDVFSSEGLIVKATYDNGKVKTVTPTSISSPDMTTIADDVVVTVTYTENGITKNTSYTIDILARPIFSVTLNDDSTVLTEASAGAGVDLPSRTAPSGYTFEGWCVTEITAVTTTEPTIIPAGTYYPLSNLTVYPVYSYEEEETIWTKITTLSTVTEGTYALITPDGYAFNGSISSGHGSVTSTAFSFNGSGIAYSAPSGLCEITLTTSSTGFTMYNATNKYLYATKAASGGLSWHNTEDSFWKYDSDWIYQKDYSGKKAHLRSYNNSTFRTYGNASNDALIMVRKSTSNVSYYISDPS